MTQATKKQSSESTRKKVLSSIANENYKDVKMANLLIDIFKLGEK